MKKIDFNPQVTHYLTSKDAIVHYNEGIYRYELKIRGQGFNYIIKCSFEDEEVDNTIHKTAFVLIEVKGFEYNISHTFVGDDLKPEIDLMGYDSSLPTSEPLGRIWD